MRSRLLLLCLMLGASLASAEPGVGPAGQEPVASTIPTDPAELERALSAADQQVRGLERRLNELDEQHTIAEARLVAFGRAYVRGTRSGLLPVAGGFGAFVEHAARLERLRRGAARELSEKQRIAVARLRLRRQLTDAESHLGVLRGQQQAMKQAHSALLAAQDRAAAFERAFSSSAGYSAVYGAPSGPADIALPSGGFAGQKGRLPFPIAGRTEIQEGRRPGIDGPGLEVRAPLGTAVNAVFAGRVAFADDYAAYGRTVILDHGGRYYTVTAGLEGISVDVGDDVVRGTRIGSVGMGPDGPGIYFEIRSGPDTVDPDDWFGL